MKNCKTRSPTPEDQKESKVLASKLEEKVMLSNIIESKPLPPSTVANASGSTNLSNREFNSMNNAKRPFINVLPSSKLLSRNIMYNRNFRKRRVSSRTTSSNKSSPNLNEESGVERTLNITLQDDLRAKILSQKSNSLKPLASTNISQPTLQQFMFPPPINLFKHRLPFSLPPRMLSNPQIQHHHPDETSFNPLPITNAIVPPPVVLVPYPVPLPIVLPIPLPISAFIKAYQVKGKETSPNNKDNNDSNKEMSSSKVRENDKPLDLSSEQSIPEHDKIFECQNDDDYENDELQDINNITNNQNIDKIPIYENIQMAPQNNLQKDLHERNRPLRKRKIISSQEESI